MNHSMLLAKWYAEITGNRHKHMIVAMDSLACTQPRDTTFNIDSALLTLQCQLQHSDSPNLLVKSWFSHAACSVICPSCFELETQFESTLNVCLCVLSMCVSKSKQEGRMTPHSVCEKEHFTKLICDCLSAGIGASGSKVSNGIDLY